MKKCSKCGKEKPLSDFAKAAGDKLRSHCRKCRAKDQMRRKINRKLRDKQLALEEAARKAVEVKENVALPRTYVTSEVWVPQDNSFYRNNGLKHIQSRGV